MISETHSAWDVIVVPFPYSDRLAEKRRPALVVSNQRLHAQGYVWIAMITGSAKVRMPGDVPIEDLKSAGLPEPSLVRVAKLATVEPDRVLRRIGALSSADRRAVRRQLLAFAAEG